MAQQPDRRDRDRRPGSAPGPASRPPRSAVLCELRDGTGLAPRRKRIITQSSRTRTNDADDRAQRQQPVVVEADGFAADRRDLLLDAHAAVGLADARRRASRTWPTRAGHDAAGRRHRACRRSARCRPAASPSAGAAAGVLVGLAQLAVRLRRRRCKPGRGQGDRPSNQSHRHPRSHALEPEAQDRAAGFARLYRRGFSRASSASSDARQVLKAAAARPNGACER